MDNVEDYLNIKFTILLCRICIPRFYWFFAVHSVRQTIDCHLFNYALQAVFIVVLHFIEIGS